LEEFPEWTIALRRAETIMFGSLPLTFAISGAAYSLALGLGANPLAESELNEAIALGAISISLSCVIALVDFLLGDRLL
jgi:hypothetical protein